MDSTHQTPYSHGGTGEECVGGRATISAVTRDASWQHTARQARLLSWLSLACMSAEGAIAIIAAVIAGSVALLGFGPDSAIERLASVIIVWRFTGTLSETAEARGVLRRRRPSQQRQPRQHRDTEPVDQTNLHDGPSSQVQAGGQVADVLQGVRSGGSGSEASTAAVVPA
jgi:hypothetical protein